MSDARAKAILTGGLIAGALDITYACTHYALVFGTPPMRILQSVAAGALGREAAVGGGWGTAAVGLALHFVITLIMALVFVTIAQRVRVLLRLWPITALVYGLLLYVVMNYVVVPNSAANGSPPEGQFFWGALFAHIALVATPIVLAARAYLR